VEFLLCFELLEYRLHATCPSLGLFGGLEAPAYGVEICFV
jgi:hypothetical protein